MASLTCAVCALSSSLYATRVVDSNIVWPWEQSSRVSASPRQPLPHHDTYLLKVPHANDLGLAVGAREVLDVTSRVRDANVLKRKHAVHSPKLSLLARIAVLAQRKINLCVRSVSSR